MKEKKKFFLNFNDKIIKKKCRNISNSIINKAILTEIPHFNNFQKKAIIKAAELS